MENKSTLSVANVAKKYDSVESTITGPHEASNGKQYFKALFEVNTSSDGGYIGQAKAYTKLFWEDSHSLIFKKATKAQENGTPLKILASRIVLETPRFFYVLDADGNPRLKANGDKVKINYVTLFLLADENVQTAYNQAVNAITKNNAWVDEDEQPEIELEAEEVVEQAASKPAPGKPAGKK